MGNPSWMKNRTLKTRPDQPDDPPLPPSELAENFGQRARQGVRGKVKGSPAPAQGEALYAHLKVNLAYCHEDPEIERFANELWDIWTSIVPRTYRPFNLLDPHSILGFPTIRAQWYHLAKYLKSNYIYKGSEAPTDRTEGVHELRSLLGRQMLLPFENVQSSGTSAS